MPISPYLIYCRFSYFTNISTIINCSFYCRHIFFCDVSQLPNITKLYTSSPTIMMETVVYYEYSLVNSSQSTFILHVFSSINFEILRKWRTFFKTKIKSSIYYNFLISQSMNINENLCSSFIIFLISHFLPSCSLLRVSISLKKRCTENPLEWKKNQNASFILIYILFILMVTSSSKL